MSGREATGVEIALVVAFFCIALLGIWCFVMTKDISAFKALKLEVEGLQTALSAEERITEQFLRAIGLMVETDSSLYIVQRPAILNWGGPVNEESEKE